MFHFHCGYVWGDVVINSPTVQKNSRVLLSTYDVANWLTRCFYLRFIVSSIVKNSLHTRDLARNDITHLDQNALEKVIRLQKLTLKQNELASLPPNLFRANHQLRQL